jgi:hypothetical protein
MIQVTSAVSLRASCFLIFGGALLAACDPNVLIGAKWAAEEGGLGGQAGIAGTLSGSGGGGAVATGGGGASAGSEIGGGGVMAGAAGAPSAGAGGEAPVAEEWCATAPVLNEPVTFTRESGDVIPQGTYLITYVSGAQIHDPDIGYEVTDFYTGKNGLAAGHHVFSGDSPETGTTSLRLDEEGIVGSGGTIAEVEDANRHHTWPLTHNVDAELRITLYDDDYHDNVGPGSRFCIKAAP